MMVKKIYVGGEYFVKDNDIIGIFDMDSATVSKKTRDFLETAEKNGEIIYSNLYEFPRSFVLTKDKTYITPIAASTLNRKYKMNLF